MKLQVFNNPEFGGIRAVEINGEPWLVGKDVAAALGYSNTKAAISDHVDDEDKRLIQRSENATLEIPNRGMLIINESGLYSLILSSKLPTAKEFKRWVTAEVLPTLRKTGSYNIQAPHLAPETSPAALEKFIRIMRRVLLDAGGIAADVLQVTISILQTWNIPVPEALTMPLNRQASFEEMGLVMLRPPRESGGEKQCAK